MRCGNKFLGCRRNEPTPIIYTEWHEGARYLFGEYLIGFPLMGNGKASILQGLMEEDDQLLKMRDGLWRRAIRGNLE